MDQHALATLLEDLPLGTVRYFDSVGSTNNRAARWAEDGAPNLSLVVTDEQTAGRGRLSRPWITPPGVALAFSLILQATGEEIPLPHNELPRMTALGALAVCDAVNQSFHAKHPVKIKWPNDVVAARHKLAGVLSEAFWQGDQLQAIILGIGINVAPGSIPPREQLDFPATCVEAVAERRVNRWRLLHEVLVRILYWRSHLTSPKFIQTWDDNLAFRGEWVQLLSEAETPLIGKITGLTSDGSLKLRTRSGEVVTIQAGEIHVRPVDIL